MNVSVLPRKNPEITPSTVPITKEMPVAANAMTREVRAPYRIRTNRSRPVLSTPRT